MWRLQVPGILVEAVEVASFLNVCLILAFGSLLVRQNLAEINVDKLSLDQVLVTKDSPSTVCSLDNGEVDFPAFADEACFAVRAAVAFVVALIYSVPLFTVKFGERLYRFWFRLRVREAFWEAFGVREPAGALHFHIFGVSLCVLPEESLLVDGCELQTFAELSIFTAAESAHVRPARLLAAWICLRICGVYSLA